MFANRYFAPRYFADRYFPDGGSVVVFVAIGVPVTLHGYGTTKLTGCDVLAELTNRIDTARLGGTAYEELRK